MRLMNVASMTLPADKGRSTYPVNKSRYGLFVALILLAALPANAQTDCVTSLASCTMACDQRLKIGDPDRPRCAQACISKYHSCTRLDLLQQNKSKVSPGILEAQ